MSGTPASSVTLKGATTTTLPKAGAVRRSEIIDRAIEAFETCEVDLRDQANAGERGCIRKRDRGIQLLIDTVEAGFANPDPLSEDLAPSYILTVTINPSGLTTSQSSDWDRAVLKLIPKDVNSNGRNEILADDFSNGILGGTYIRNVPPGLYGFELSYKD